MIPIKDIVLAISSHYQVSIWTSTDSHHFALTLTFSQLWEASPYFWWYSVSMLHLFLNQSGMYRTPPCLLQVNLAAKSSLLLKDPLNTNLRINLPSKARIMRRWKSLTKMVLFNVWCSWPSQAMKGNLQNKMNQTLKRLMQTLTTKKKMLMRWIQVLIKMMKWLNSNLTLRGEVAVKANAMVNQTVKSQELYKW